MNRRLERAPIGVLETAPDGEITAANEAAADLFEVERASLVGLDVREAFPGSAAGPIRAAFDEGPSDGHSFEEYYPTVDRWLAVELARVDGSVLVYLRDRTRRHEDESHISRLERRLDRMETIDALVATVLGDLVDADDREEVPRTIVDRLGDTDLYEFALVAERDVVEDRLRVVAAAGDEDLGARIEAALGGTGTGEGDTATDGDAPSAADIPERVAVDTGETKAIGRIAATDSIPKPVRLAAFAGGLQSCLAVPLSYRGTVYGVLSVYTSREGGFDAGERTSLETLGAVAGFAINAIRQEGLLFADTVTELTLEVRDDSIPFVAAAAAAAEVSLVGAVPRGDDRVVCYVSVADSLEAARRTLSAHDAVVSTRRVSDGGDGDGDGSGNGNGNADADGTSGSDTPDSGLLEVELDGAAPVATLAAWGATIRTATYADGVARVVAAVPPDDEPRRLLETVGAAFEDVDVVAKTRTERDPQSAGGFRTDLEERLTDRQRTVLRTAYLSEYFASPRGSTAEEVAEALGITGPTVLYHLRNAQRSLLDVFFAGDSEVPVRERDDEG
jgi:hypothetical protein